MADDQAVESSEFPSPKDRGKRDVLLGLGFKHESLALFLGQLTHVVSLEISTVLLVEELTFKAISSCVSVVERDRRLIGVNSDCSYEEEASPDQEECSEHVRDILGNLSREELLSLTFDFEFLHSYVLWVAKSVHDNAKEKSAETKSADDKPSH